MKKVLFCIVLTAALVLPAMSLPAFALPGEVAVEVSTIDLLESWQELDGREVILRGEAVGDVMRRGGYAWITGDDDASTFVWCFETV